MFYEVQCNRLSSGSNYNDLGNALYDAAADAVLGSIDLGDDITWNAIPLQKVVNAVLAVEIVE